MQIKLTEFSHGGGCGCKIAPGLLHDLLSKSSSCYPDLLVGRDTSDDAAVYRINEAQAIVATTDFFMPIVDDARDFGRIAATNAISDIYAMGARPLFALAVVGMPIDKLPLETMRAILEGGESVCAAAGIPVAGGHSIDSPEPVYGLAVTGIVHPDRIKRNDRARAGDILILGKPLGIGILSAALKKGKLSGEGYRAMLDATTQLNTPGMKLAEMREVHAMTDVTGFGLLGHLLELCRGSHLGAVIGFDEIPFFQEAGEHCMAGIAPGAVERNWTSYGHEVELDFPDWKRKLLCDPQTSGGLLVACAPEVEHEVLDLFQKEGFFQAKKIGQLHHGDASVKVR